jgi:protein-tyrosine phosphatase
MIDIHSHILPGVDDGAKSWDIALEMCGLAHQDGIEHMVATSHANDSYTFDRESLTVRLNQLRSRVGDIMTFSLGCDFHLSYKNVADALARPQYYTIAEGQYLLVEFSDYGIPPQIGDSLFHLRAIGITPIITHPERNPILQRHREQVLRWVQQGCLVQVTASALTGTWGESARRSAHWLLERLAVHVIATDAHDHKQRRPILSAARRLVTDRYGEDVAQALVEDNPRAIVANEQVPFLPEPMTRT